jgi:hypothetical protein
MRRLLTEGATVFVGELHPERIAYIDGGATSLSSTVDALVVDVGSELDEPAAALGALLAPTCDALADASSDMEVTGDGAVARSLRRLHCASQPVASPSTIVDLTGDPAVIRDALGRLEDLGTLLLGRDPVGTLDLDLYQDVHVRGLRVVGVGRPRHRRCPTSVPADVGAPIEAVLGQPIADGAAWYRVSAGAS